MNEQKFPFPSKAVYNHLIKIIPNLGMDLLTNDAIIGRITASTSVSLTSWGESISITIESISEDETMVRLDSGLKFGWAGKHRNKKNTEDIIYALSRSLQNKPPQAKLSFPFKQIFIITGLIIIIPILLRLIF